MENEFDKDELEVIRKMIERERALSWFGTWFRNFLLVLAGGVVTLYAAYEILSKR